jgi:aryl-alcohol dehydrogenase-like predicted oxidoreductase
LEYTLLGSTGLKVSRLCFGTLTISPLQRGFGAEEGAALLKSARESGVTFFDTAEIYRTYAHLKAAFAGDDSVVISTKCYAYDKAGAAASLEKARREPNRLSMVFRPCRIASRKGSTNTPR